MAEGETPEIVGTTPKPPAFFDAMKEAGFGKFMLSVSDTGQTKIHTNGTASEWWVAFWHPEVVMQADDLPHGFLDPKLEGEHDYERTPYGFPFRTVDRKLDFVLISVHLAPGAREAARRKQELDGIHAWIERNRGDEKDFIVLGDMNLESCAVLSKATTL